MASSLIDISRPLHDEMSVWPGSAPFRREILTSFERGGEFRESQFAMNIHTGTHMDRPSHFVRAGETMDSLDLSRMQGRCMVIDAGMREVLDRDFVKSLDLTGISRVLFRTRNSFSNPRIFDAKFVAFTADAAEYLVECGVRLVGIDGPSVERFADPNHRTHEALLGGDVVVIENLILADAPAGLYTLIALPLKLQGAEGSPLRAALIKGRFDESFD